MGEVKLSVSMIVKNEQENIAQCLNSVKDADEIIVVDTGSKDETPDIAKSMGAKVFFFPWRDNFAEAYNFADSRCQGDWILSIDADERLEEGGIKKIRKLIKDEKADWIDVKIDYEKGLEAHSDGDVVLHALSDALLGAAALGDIGKHFPDTDPEFKGADSRVLLRHVYGIVQQKGYQLVNADITIIAQAPKMVFITPLPITVKSSMNTSSSIVASG